MPDGSTNPAPAVRPASPVAPVLTEILHGLSQPQKTLPAKLFYDETGCTLFGQITRLPEYYVTRAETALLTAHAAEIAAYAPPAAALVEYGASDEAKAAMLLDALPGRFAAYVPIDIAEPALRRMRTRMRNSHPDLAVHVLPADFLAPLELPRQAEIHAPFGFFPGSTIGNLDPATAAAFLRQAARTLGVGLGGAPAQFVVGTDLRKNPAILVPAYDDAAGVTARFNRNMLTHINRIAGARFDAHAFDHKAVWNDAESRIEMHLVSRHAQQVEIGGRAIGFAAGESIHTENSYKHSPDGFAALAAAVGWRRRAFWTDPDGLFGMHLLTL